MQISRILHAGYVFESQDTRILFDPLFENPFSRNCHAFPQVQLDRKEIKNHSFSAVFISHYHDDHCSLESLDLVARTTPIYIYCLHEELLELLKNMGFCSVSPLAINKPVSVGPFTITPRRAFDKDVDCLLQIQTATLNMLNVVDSWIDGDTLHLLTQNGPWDFVAWPFQTLREIDVLSPTRQLPASVHVPEEWLEQLTMLAPRVLVPSSCQFQMEEWSWYNNFLFPISYEQFAQDVKAKLPDTRILRLDPSESITLTSLSITPASPFKGVKLLDTSKSDYNFDPQAPTPATKEVAQKLPALSPQHVQETLLFLSTTLLKTWSTLELDSSDYFARPRAWHLTTWDHHGDPQDFYYNLSVGACSRTTTPHPALEWRTEIPLYTLYGALKNGDSLTSLYIRINDLKFSDATERELADTSPLSDPLLRCLYTGAFASYQKAQLGRLRQRKFDR